MKRWKRRDSPYWGFSTITKRGKKTGNVLRWAVYGWHSTPLDDPNEPLRIHSVKGWRGSKKYPFGIAFKDPF